jgi:hypothetical protein
MKLRHRKLFIAAALSALASMAILASVANAATPAPPYQDFAGCPSEAENENVASCFKYDFTGGHLKLGGAEVAITKPIVFRGGYESVTGNYVGNSEAGIVPVQQKVTGGLGQLLGVPWLLESFAPSLLKVNATVELAGNPGSLAGYPLTLPVKIHLQNPVIGNSCYIGSSASPIALSLGTGTTNPPAPNKPITGQPAGPLTPEAERPEVETAAGGVLVDNAFAVPTATGCNGLAKTLNSAIHLPSGAGHNEAVLNFDLSLAFSFVVNPS